MKRIALFIGALVGALSLASAAPAHADHAGPTPAQMQSALIGANDLAPGFSKAWSGTLADGRGAGAVYRREWPVFELVSVGVASGYPTTPAREARDYIQALTGSSDYRTLIAPSIGRETVRYIYVFDNNGTTMFGDIVAWRQGDVVVMVAVDSEDLTASPVSYAQRQYTRLTRPFN